MSRRDLTDLYFRGAQNYFMDAVQHAEDLLCNSMEACSEEDLISGSIDLESTRDALLKSLLFSALATEALANKILLQIRPRYLSERLEGLKPVDKLLVAQELTTLKSSKWEPGRDPIQSIGCLMGKRNKLVHPKYPKEWSQPVKISRESIDSWECSPRDAEKYLSQVYCIYKDIHLFSVAPIKEKSHEHFSKSLSTGRHHCFIKNMKDGKSGEKMESQIARFLAGDRRPP